MAGISMNNTPKRDPIVEQLSSKLKNSTPWKTKDFSDDVNGKFNASIQGIMKYWKLNSSNFYLYWEGILREIAQSFNGKIPKLLHQVYVKMIATPPTLLPESKTYAIDEGVKIYFGTS